VRLTDEQIEGALANLGNGSTIREAALMVGAPWTTFAADWLAGRADHEGDRDTPEAEFYRKAQAARANQCARARAQAKAVAGTRESSDLLAYVKALESEVEPLAEEGDKPNAVRLLAHESPDVRAAAEDVQTACRTLLHVLTAKDDATRVRTVTA
jgi:hypothetical protein